MTDGSTAMVADFQSLAALFLAQAKRYGERALYRYYQSGEWRILTWAQSLSQVREIALGLVSLGIRRGDRAALLSNNRLEWLLSDWANICVGVLTVPIYSSSAPAQAVHIVGHADPKVLFIDSLTRCEKLDFSRTPLSQLKYVITIDKGGTEAAEKLAVEVLTLDDLRQAGRAYERQHGDAFERLAQSLRPEDDLTIIYTSGTTGTPKGVLTTHGNYLFMIRAVDRAVPSTDGDVTLHFLPTAHSLGRLEHFMAVAKGWTLGLARSIETVATDLKVIRPTVIFSVPRIYQNACNRMRQRVNRGAGWRRKVFDWTIAMGKVRSPWPAISLRALAFACVDSVLFARLRAGFGGRLRLAISGGAPLPREVAEFFGAIGIEILEGYGLTETSTVSHVNRPGRSKPGTVGLPLDGTLCALAPDGEILLRGPHIFKTYYRDLIATQEAIDADGWFHTGDMGTIDNEGYLHVSERKRDLIVTSGGKKVAPQRIENLLTADPLIHHAVVVGRGQRHLMALITLNQNRAIELARAAGVTSENNAALADHTWTHERVRDIVQRVNRQVAAYEAIRAFTILDRDFTVADEELTPTLKPRRQAIIERYKDLIDDLYRKAS